jgi:predicted xylose isomerase-like sugar epimerase
LLNDNLCTVHEVDINWQKNKMAVASIVQGEKRRAQWNKIGLLISSIRATDRFLK